MLKTAMIFTNKMVLQRDKKIPVWGKGESGKKVCVSLDGNSAETIVGADGNWKLELSEHAAGTDYEMTITDGDETITLSDVCVGEVWIAGGQSNMEYILAFEKHFDEVQANERNPYIRFFDYPEVSYEGQLEDFDYKNYGFWRGCTADDLQWFSAVGYYFSKMLNEDLNVPVGIVGCNWGGTTACSWMSREKLVGTEGEFWVTNFDKACAEIADVEKYIEEFKANPANNRTSELENPFSVEFVKVGKSREEQLAIMKAQEEAGISYDQILGPYYERRPGGLYETMLKKIVPYAMRGAIWYQGESDADENPSAYKTVFAKMIENWRELWNEEFPFLFVQLAPFSAWMQCYGDNYPALRAAQDIVSKNVPGAYMASIGDVGMEFDIHPKNKIPVGERLGLLARKYVYGENDILADAPEAVEALKDGDKIVVLFENGNGLSLEGDKLNAMKGLLSDGSLVDLTEAVTVDDKLIISGCEEVDELQFASTPYYKVNVFNESHIPVKPFVMKL